jgi:acyl carrier protein
MTAKTVAVTLTGPRLDGYEFPGPAAAAAAVCALTGTQAPVTLRARPGRRPLGSQAGQRVWVSWSHTRQGVAAAASTRPVGVDCEQCRPLRTVDGIHARLNTAGLAGVSTACSVVQRWCVLEAALKSLGTGFALSLERIRLTADGLHVDGAGTGLRQTTVPVDAADGRYHASVVHHGHDVRWMNLSSLNGNPPFHIVRAHPGSASSSKEEHVSTVIDKEELRTIIADTIDQDVEEVTDTASFVGDLEVDSLMALELVIVLERKYGVKFKEEMLPQVTSLQAAHELLSNEMAKTA